jgi:hypothetical protein
MGQGGVRKRNSNREYEYVAKCVNWIEIVPTPKKISSEGLNETVHV